MYLNCPAWFHLLFVGVVHLVILWRWKLHFQSTRYTGSHPTHIFPIHPSPLKFQRDNHLKDDQVRLVVFWVIFWEKGMFWVRQQILCKSHLQKDTCKADLLNPWLNTTNSYNNYINISVFNNYWQPSKDDDWHLIAGVVNYLPERIIFFEEVWTESWESFSL
jgi:hypothetical protein